MATEITVDAETIARTFAKAVQHETAVCQLWLLQHHDVIELWVVTTPTDAETERRIAGYYVDLFAAHPRARIMLHLLNPRYFADDATLQRAIPRGATPIPLHARSG